MCHYSSPRTSRPRPPSRRQGASAAAEARISLSMAAAMVWHGDHGHLSVLSYRDRCQGPDTHALRRTGWHPCGCKGLWCDLRPLTGQPLEQSHTHAHWLQKGRPPQPPSAVDSHAEAHTPGRRRHWCETTQPSASPTSMRSHARARSAGTQCYRALPLVHTCARPMRSRARPVAGSRSARVGVPRAAMLVQQPQLVHVARSARARRVTSRTAALQHVLQYSDAVALARSSFRGAAIPGAAVLVRIPQALHVATLGSGRARRCIPSAAILVRVPQARQVAKPSRQRTCVSIPGAAVLMQVGEAVQARRGGHR
jgi:hypothetical protein